MIKSYLTGLSNVRPMYAHAFFTAIILFSCLVFVQAQPEFSAEELLFMKKHNAYSDAYKSRLPQERFPMPNDSNQTRLAMTGGDLDAAYNASVTEGFGYTLKTVVQPDGKIIVVGLFQRANGVKAYGIARLNSDGTLDTGFNTGTGANAAVRSVAVQSDGKIVVVGAFSAFNGQTVNRIVRLNSNGSVDTSFTASTQIQGTQVNDVLLLPNGKILVGGAIGVSSTALVRLNTDGSLDSPIAGFFGTIFTLANAPDSKILVGGDFTGFIKRLNGDLTVDSTFNPGSGAQTNGIVLKTVAQPDGKVLIGGNFSLFNGVEVDGLVRLNATGAIDAVYEVTSDPLVQYLAVQGIAVQPDGKITASFIDETNNIILDVKRFNPNGSIDPTFNTNSNNSIPAVDVNLLADGTFMITGFFDTINGQPKIRLAKLNADGSLNSAFSPAISTVGSVYAIKRQADGKILIGGDFEYVNGVKKGAIARLNPDGTLDNTFTLGAGLLGDIYAIELQSDGKVIIGGLFGGNESFPAAAVARLNSDGSFDAGLNNFGGRFIAGAYALDIQADGKILIGGSIFDPNFRSLSAIRVNTDRTLDASFNAPILGSGQIRALIVHSSGKIILGGNFSSAVLNRTGLLALNTDGSLNSGTFSGNGIVYTIVELPDGAILSGGGILARYSPEGVRDNTLDIGTGFNSSVRAVEILPDGKFLLGGSFTTYKGVPVNRLIRISNTGELDTTFTASPAGPIFALNKQSDGKVLVGGQFLDFNNTEKLSIVRLNTGSSRRTPFDFDGDGKTDISIFRPAGGEWWIQRSSDNQIPAAQFGDGTDKIVPADYTGDGKTDIAFFRPSTGQWFILRSEDSSFYAFPFGAAGDVPAPADYDGDGKTDAAVFRPSNSSWYILNSSGGVRIEQFGLNNDVPVPADYDGDGKADIGIYRNGDWWINRSTSGLFAVNFGDGADKPVSGDYTGDGKTDIAFWRPSTGQWFVLRSENLSYYGAQFGATGDIPAPGDYDGDGKFDFAVFRPSNTGWYVNRSTAGLMIQQFGLSADKPVPSAYIP